MFLLVLRKDITGLPSLAGEQNWSMAGLKKNEQTQSHREKVGLMYFMLLQQEKHLLSRWCQRFQEKACCLRSWCQVNQFQFIPLLRPLITSIIFSAWSPADPVPLTFVARPYTWKMGLAMGLAIDLAISLAMSLAASFSVTDVRQLDDLTSQEPCGLMELFNGILHSVL